MLALAWRGQAAALRGRLDQARHLAEEGLAMGRRSENPFDQMWGHSAPATVYNLLRDGERGLAHADAELALASEHKIELFAAIGLAQRGSARIESGDREAGIEELREGVARLRALGTIVASPSFLAQLAEHTKDPAEALPIVEEGLALAAEQRGFRPNLLRVRAGLLARMGAEAEAVEAAHAAAIEDGRRIGARLYELTAARDFARWLCDQGRPAEAHAVLAPVYASFREGLASRDLVEAEALLDELASAAGA